jgi:hypothetical protein
MQRQLAKLVAAGSNALKPPFTRQIWQLIKIEAGQLCSVFCGGEGGAIGAGREVAALALCCHDDRALGSCSLGWIAMHKVSICCPCRHTDPSASVVANSAHSSDALSVLHICELAESACYMCKARLYAYTYIIPVYHIPV